MDGWGSSYSTNGWGGGGTVDQCVDHFVARGLGKNCRNVKVDGVRPPGGGDFVPGFWSYRQVIAYWVPGARRPTIALDCRNFSTQTASHRSAVEYAAGKKRIPTICMGFPFSRTWGGSGREGFLTRGERWTAGVRSSVGVPRKVRSAAAATNRALERWKALDHDDPRSELLYEEYRRLSEVAYPLRHAAWERLGDREAIRYAIASAHAKRLARLPDAAEDWDPFTRKVFKLQSSTRGSR